MLLNKPPQIQNLMDKYTREKCQGASFEITDSYYQCLSDYESYEHDSGELRSYERAGKAGEAKVSLSYFIVGDYFIADWKVQEPWFNHSEFRRKKVVKKPYQFEGDLEFLNFKVDGEYVLKHTTYPYNVGTGKATSINWTPRFIDDVPVVFCKRATAQSGSEESNKSRWQDPAGGVKIKNVKHCGRGETTRNGADVDVRSPLRCCNKRKTKLQSLSDKIAKANFEAIKKVEMAQDRRAKNALKNLSIALRKARLAKTEEYLVTPQMGLGVPVHHGFNKDAKEFLNVFKEDILSTLSTMHGSTISAVNDAKRVVEESVRSNPINDALTSMTMAIWIIPVVCLIYYVSTRSDLSMHVKGMITFLSLLLPVAFSPLLKLLSSKVEVVVPQTGGIDFDFLKKLIAMGTLIIGMSKFNGDICDFVMSVLEKGPQRMISANTYTGFMAWVITGIEDVINAIRHVFGKESITLLKTGQRDVDDWADRLEFVLQGIITDSIKVDIDLVHTLTALRCEATELMKLYRFKKDISGMLEKYLRRLDDVCSKNASVFSAAKNTRVEPVCLALVGKPGVGKTLLCTAVAAEVISRLASEEKLRDPSFNVGADIFQKGSSKYDNGYVGQCVYVMDDAFQQVYAEGDQDNDFMRLIRVVNSWMLPLDFADVENKGKNFFRSKFVMITTNVYKLSTIAQNCVNDPSAVVRRIHHPYELGVNDDFRLPGTTKWQEKCIDTAKVTAFQREHGRFPFEAWTIRRHNFLEGVAAEQREYSFQELIPEMVDEIKRNKERHDDVGLMCRNIVNQRLNEIERMRNPEPAKGPLKAEDVIGAEEVPILVPHDAEEVIGRRVRIPVVETEGDTDSVPSLEEISDNDSEAGSVVRQHAVDVSDDNSSVSSAETEEGVAVDVTKNVVPQVGPSVDALTIRHNIWGPDKIVASEQFKKKWLKARNEYNTSLKKWFTRCRPDTLGILVAEISDHHVTKANWEDIPEDELQILVAMRIDLAHKYETFLVDYNSLRRQANPNGGFNANGYWCSVEELRTFKQGFFTRAANKIWERLSRPYFYGPPAKEEGGLVAPNPIDVGFKKYLKGTAKALLNTFIAIRVILSSAIICVLEVLNTSPVLKYIMLFAFGYIIASIVKNVLSSMSTYFTGDKGYVENQAVNFKTLVNLSAPVESKMDIHKSVVKNLYRAVVIRDGGYFHLGNVTGIVGKIFCIPTHFFESVRLEKEKKTMKAGDKIVFINTGNRNLEFEIELDSFCALKRKTFDETDCSFVEFPVGISAHDISSKFLTDKEISSFSTFQCTFATSTQERNNVERVWFHETAYKMNSTLGVGESDLKYNVKRTFRYKIPTVGGDCGGILMLGPNVRAQSNGAKIVGFHTGANMSLGTGFSTIVTREMVTEAITFFKATVEEEVSDKNVVAQSDNQFVEGSVMPLYELEVGTKAAPYSKLCKTFLYNAWSENTKYPTPLGHHVKDGVTIKPMIAAVNKYTGKVIVYDQEEIKCAAYTAFLPLTECSKNVIKEERVVMTFEEAIIGDPNDPMMNSIPRNTSAGYPRSLEKGVNGKKDFFGFDDEYDLSSENAKVLKADVEDIIEKAEKNIRKLHIFTDFLKDERRQTGKAARLVSGAPIAYVVAFRMYFLKFISTMMKERITNGCCAGINVYKEWQYLWNHLTSMSLTGIAGDYSAFDSSEQPQFHEEILSYINGWYDDGEKNATVRKVLWLELTHSRHLGGDGKENRTVYQWFHSLPSGHPATTITNSMYNLMLFVMCFQRILGTNALVDYHKLVRPVVLGDDNVVAIHPSIQDRFNQDTITVEMKKLGMTYTSEDKDSLVAPIRELKTVGFLKRGFRSEIVDGVDTILGPLSLDTIREMPYWCRNKGEMEQICCDNFETALIELSAHPKCVWEDLGAKMIKAYKDSGRNTAIAPERNLYLRRFLDMDKAF